MAEIEYDIDEDTITKRSNARLARVIFGRKKRPALVKFLKKIKIAKNDNQAYNMLFALTIIIFLMTVGLIMYALHNSTQSNDLPEDIPPWLLEHIQNRNQQPS